MREGWVCEKLSNCIKLKSGDGLTAKKMIAGDFPVFGGNGIAGYHNAYNLEGKNIIIGRVGAQCGNARFTDEKIWLTDNAFKISEFKYDFNFQFLNYLLNHIDLRSYARQAAQPVISNSSLKNVELCFPTSVEEQKQIVAILDKAFAAIDQAQANIEKNIENAKELFQSKLNEIFSQKGEGWEEKTLGELGKVSMCKRILKKQTNTESGIPFYKIGTFGKEANAFISEEIYNEFKNKYSFPKKGEILLSASGTIGRRVIYDGKPAYFQDSNIVWIANNEEEVLNEFLYEFYGFCDWNPSRGATISRLYNDDLRRIKITYPGKETQKIIVQEIKELYSNTEAIESHYQQKISNLDDLKKSILQKAFSGELTQKEVAV